MDGWLDALGADLRPGWSVVATGGYAGGLLCPGSDVDVVLLHPKRASGEEIRAAAEGMWYPMWDAGLKLSPSAHSVESLLALASNDLPTATTILRLRHLVGDPTDVGSLGSGAHEQWRKGARRWLDEIRALNNERWAKFGDVASLLEPDLKDGQGGLRDFDGIRWALAVERPLISAALDGPFEDLIGPAEFLLAVRCELHRATGKTSNVLLLQDQDEVAEAMGFASADVLMSRVSEAARAIDWASERFWGRVERMLRSWNRPPPRSRITATLQPGVTVVDDEVHVDIARTGSDESLILRVAADAAHAGYPLSRRALIALSGTTSEVGEVWHERTRRAMISLLGAGDHLVGTVEALEQFELFSRMLPEWFNVRSRPQRNAFHTYTVDRHLLQTVVNAGMFVRQVARPDLLLMGALLHDLGKGFPGDHTDAGVELVDRIAPRMGFAPADVDVLRSLVEHHLLLPETATRRDLSDPRTAETVAEKIGDPGRLDLLRALTEADSLATGPSAWSSWKESLLDVLTSSVKSILAGLPPASADEPHEAYADLLEEVRCGTALASRHTRVDDLDLWVVAAKDRPGLFAKIAGVLTVHGLQVISAEAWTSADGVAIDQFQVLKSGGTTNWARLRTDLDDILNGVVDVADRIRQRVRGYSRSHRRALVAAPPRLEVLVSNDASATATMLDVRAPDGIAVLYRLASSLAAAGLDIRSAKVATLGHEVIDVFYVQRSGHPAELPKVPVSEHAALADRMKSALTAD